MTASTRVRRCVLKLLKESQDRGGKNQGIQRILEPLIEVESWDRMLLALSNIHEAYTRFSAQHAKRTGLGRVDISKLVPVAGAA